jgi:hypothetical protein
MTASMRRRIAFLYCALAGACDSLTGLLLVFVPLVTLDLMRITTTPAEPVYLRFIGAFVAGVGVSYLYPFLARDRGGLEHRLSIVLEVTALVRIGIAAFVTFAIAAGDLSMGWSTVVITDVGLATAQILVVRRWVLASPSAGERQE